MVPAIPISGAISPFVQEIATRALINIGLNVIARVVNNRIQGGKSDNSADEIKALKASLEEALIYDTGEMTISTAESLKSIETHLEAIEERLTEGFDVPLHISLDMDGMEIAEWNWQYSK